MYIIINFKFNTTLKANYSNIYVMRFSMGVDGTCADLLRTFRN